MVASSFHPFPRLPAELRLQIWIAACVSYRPGDYGIHYIDVEPSSTEGILLPYHRSMADVVVSVNNSACLRNGGLWTACKESRDVMIQHSRVDGLDCARISIRENEGEWDSPVCPTHDIFCIKSNAWNTPGDHAEGWQIQIPDLSPKGSQTTHIKNIALEFDESWNIDLPESYYDLMSETSARGFLSRLLYNKYLNDLTTPYIWIIVKNGQWTFDHYNTPHYKTKPLHDYDTEYVPVSPYFTCRHCLRTHDFDGVFQNVKTFIRILNDLGEDCEKDHPDFTPDYDDVEYGAFSEQFQITEGVRFLAPRDKQIDLCTGAGGG
ncbi:hypothetical protein DER46DRAFT_515676 [Fusarium sp. MPI-SDFR-AT-0072]|nr:hypothetical protein DER46DRAFT_515676 [Fusarium sp. MPI-SDFR-AT-0072]KAI7763678.1 hypothetical protein LZL87_011535 [Fusarium oxysporum]